MKSKEIKKKINEMKNKITDLESTLKYQELTEEVVKEYPGIKVTAIGNFENKPDLTIAKGYQGDEEVLLARVYYTVLQEVGWIKCSFIELKEDK